MFVMLCREILIIIRYLFINICNVWMLCLAVRRTFVEFDDDVIVVRVVKTSNDTYLWRLRFLCSFWYEMCRFINFVKVAYFPSWVVLTLENIVYYYIYL